MKLPLLVTDHGLSIKSIIQASGGVNLCLDWSWPAWRFVLQCNRNYPETK